MDWVKLATRYYTDAAVLAAGVHAEILFVRALAYCGDQEKGGLVPAAALPLLTVGLPKAASTRAPAALVAAGLWEVVPGGWVVTGWDDHQTSLDQLSAQRQATRERVARHRENKHRRRNAVTNVVSNGGGSADVTPTEVEVEGEEEDAAAAASRGAAADAPASSPHDDLPPAVAILRQALEAHRLHVRWDRLTADQLATIERLVALHGDTRLVKAAVAAYRPDRPAAFAQAWLSHWEALPAPGAHLHAVTAPPCPQPGHSGTTSHCTQCAADALADDTTPRRKARR